LTWSGFKAAKTAFPRQLSGGQQQRVGIARSLAVEPELWFLDEPFSALDPLIRRQMQDEFLRIQSTLKKSIVFITHDFLEALRIADRMMIMRDGMVVQVGTPVDLIINPADDSYVAEFTSDVPLARVLQGAGRDGRSTAKWPRRHAVQDCNRLCRRHVLPCISQNTERRCHASRRQPQLGVVTARQSVIVALSRGTAEISEAAQEASAMSAEADIAEDPQERAKLIPR
jgi:glycine betaine/proline transport system ATP-binding protein